MTKFIKTLLCFFLIKTISAQAEYALPTYEWHDFEFGRVRLISERTTFTPDHPLYLGVQVTPNEGWKISDPILKATASAHAIGSVFIPFEQPQEDTYYYPVAFTMTPTDQPITFFVQGKIPACKGQNCTNADVNLNLTLKPGYGLLTPEQPDLSDTLALTPVPMHLNRVMGWAVQNNDQVNITLDLPLAPGKISLYNTDKKPIQTEIQTQKKRVTFQLPKTTGDQITFILDATNTIYAIDLPLLPADTKVPNAPTFSWWFWIFAWGCILLFYLYRRFIYKNRA